MTIETTAISWKWLAVTAVGLLTSLTFVASGAVISVVWSEVEKLKEKDAAKSTSIEVIKRDVDEIKERSREQERKLDRVLEYIGKENERSRPRP